MKIETYELAKKAEEMLRLLKHGAVMVFVDSRCEGVVVPDHLKNDFQLRLNFDYAFEIDNFQVHPDRVEASLSFNRKNFFCVIPFDAVYLLVNHFTRQGSLFAESIPVEMLEVFTGLNQQRIEREQKLARFKVIEEKPAEAPTSLTEAEQGTKEKEKKNKSHLRVVK